MIGVRHIFTTTRLSFRLFRQIDNSVLTMDIITTPMEINDDEDVSSDTDTWFYNDQDIDSLG